MLRLGSTYLIVKDFEKSLSFYSDLLDMKPTGQNEDRWAQFDFYGSCIALWNPEYDFKLMDSPEDLSDVYSQNYIDYQKQTKINYGNNVVLNFYVADLEIEHQRVKSLQIGEVTEIMYINVAMPYYLFILIDPDGNQIEVTGNVGLNLD